MTITAEEFYNKICCFGRRNVLMIDERPAKDFELSHLEFAVNFPHSPSEPLSEAQIRHLFERLEDPWFAKVLIVDESAPPSPRTPRLLSNGAIDNEEEASESGSENENDDEQLLLRRAEDEHRRKRMLSIISKCADFPPHCESTVYFIESFAEIKDKFPFFCLGADTPRPTKKLKSSCSSDDEDDPTWPSLVINDWLYLGDITGASCRHVLDSLSIKNVVNCTDDEENKFDGDSCLQYHRVNVSDCDTSNIAQYFDTVFEFIDKAREREQKVLIHCHAGVSRSATMTIAYLMRRNKWTLKSALEHVQKKRSIVRPNAGFMRQLCELERQLYSLPPEGASVSMPQYAGTLEQAREYYKQEEMQALARFRERRK